MFDEKENYIDKEINGYKFKIDKNFYNNFVQKKVCQAARQARIGEFDEKEVEFTRIVLEYMLIQFPYIRTKKQYTGLYADLNNVKDLDELQKLVREGLKKHPWSEEIFIITGQKKLIGKEELNGRKFIY